MRTLRKVKDKEEKTTRIFYNKRHRPELCFRKKIKSL